MKIILSIFLLNSVQEPLMITKIRKILANSDNKTCATNRKLLDCWRRELARTRQHSMRPLNGFLPFNVSFTCFEKKSILK